MLCESTLFGDVNKVKLAIAMASQIMNRKD